MGQVFFPDDLEEPGLDRLGLVEQFTAHLRHQIDPARGIGQGAAIEEGRVRHVDDEEAGQMRPVPPREGRGDLQPRLGPRAGVQVNDDILNPSLTPF